MVGLSTPKEYIFAQVPKTNICPLLFKYSKCKYLYKKKYCRIRVIRIYQNPLKIYVCEGYKTRG